MKPYRFSALLMLVAFAAMGCASALPKSAQTTETYWSSHQEAEAVYAVIEPGKSTRLQLRAVGFDIKRVPNSKRIEYLEIRNLLLGTNANAKIEDLPEGAQACLKAKDRCVAEIYKLGTTNKDEEGNFIANKTDYRVIKRTTGWAFNPTFFIIKSKKDQESDNDLVVYATKDDNPNINQVETKEDKMGPVKTLLSPIRGLLCLTGICF